MHTFANIFCFVLLNIFEKKFMIFFVLRRKKYILVKKGKTKSFDEYKKMLGN